MLKKVIDKKGETELSNIMDERNINAFLDRLIADFNSVIRQAEEVLKEETVEFNYKSKCYGNIKK